MNILLLNAGSSSLKTSVLDRANGTVRVHGSADWAGAQTHYRFQVSGSSPMMETVSWKGHEQGVDRFLRDLEQNDAAAEIGRATLTAVGHRFVHGGEFTTSLQINDDVRSKLAALADLAPLHNPPSLETLDAAEEELPEVPHVAVFDTTFHATLPPEAYRYPLPRQWNLEWGIRRYGFHGLSHAYCSRRAAEMLGRPVEDLKLVICHLGHGCSAAAVKGGRCVDTTMGFTPLDGLMMATRSGSVDPGILFYVQQHHGLTVEQVEVALNRESGLLGVSGISADMREVQAAADEGHADAMLALAIYAHRVRQAVGALAVTMGGVDALIFTAGVGEHASGMRASICEGLDCLGLKLDPSANAESKPDADVSAADSTGRILVIGTREDLEMYREVVRVTGA